jgi:hypothetical protein
MASHLPISILEIEKDAAMVFTVNTIKIAACLREVARLFDE